MQGDHKPMMRRSPGFTSLFTLFILISNRIRRARSAHRGQVLQLRLAQVELLLPTRHLEDVRRVTLGLLQHGLERVELVQDRAFSL
jgi:hypothetical protein